MRGSGLSWEEVKDGVDLGGSSVMLRKKEVGEREGEKGGLKRSEGGRVKNDESREEGKDGALWT